MKNYLPFALREISTVAHVDANTGVGPPSAIQVASFDVGFGGRTILQDLCVYDYLSEGSPSTNLLMRVGWLGKGYITEKRLPAGLFVNKSRPLVPVWELPRPYVLWPNQQLRSRIAVDGSGWSTQGLVFNGVRLKDNRPCMLYDTTEEAMGATPQAGFADRSLRCPGEPPVAIHSVGISYWDEDRLNASLDVQIWSPQGREWFHCSPYAGAPPPAQRLRWIDPPTDLLALGEERGWVIGTGQTFLVEFESLDTSTDMQLVTTLRGCVEIEEEIHG